MRYFIYIFFILIMVLSCTGCVYEFMTARLYGGEYIDVERPIKAKATVDKINILEEDNGITLLFSYSNLLNDNLSYESDTYKNISKNNCLQINMHRFLLNDYVNGTYSKTTDETDYYLNNLKNINYDEILVNVVVKNNKGAKKKILVKTDYEVFSKYKNNMLKTYPEYREIYFDQSVKNFEFINICESKGEKINKADVPMIYKESTIKYKYKNSIIKRIFLTPFAFAFDLVSLPILIIIEAS